MRVRVLACSSALALFLAVSWARAQTETRAPASGVVAVTVLGTTPDLERIRASIGPSDFDGAATRWGVRDRWDVDELLRAEPEPDTSVRCWIDVSEQGRARLYFADAARERFLLRDVPLPEGLSDLGRESLAQVLEMSVTALLEDGRAGMSRSETERILEQREPLASEPLASEPSPKRPAPVELGTPALGKASEFELRAFYSARLYSGEARVVHGPGLAVAWVTGGGPTGISPSISVGYELPREVSARWVGLEWQSTTLRGSIDLTRRFGEGEARGYARLGGGLDLVRIEPKRVVDDPALTVTSERMSAEAVLNAALGACVPFGRSVGACAHLSGDFYPVLVHYEVREYGATSSVFVPWRFRPGLLLALVLH